MITLPSVEQYRVTEGDLASDATYGNNGAFRFPNEMFCIVSDGEGWDHVSVSYPDRCPTWNEMCFVKDIFWAAEEEVIQIHPPEKDYVNYHEFCLHLWRSQTQSLIMPPSLFVGPEGVARG